MERLELADEALSMVQRKMTSLSESDKAPLSSQGMLGLEREVFDTMGWLLGTQATLIRRCHVVLMSAEAFANLISRGGARRPLI